MKIISRFSAKLVRGLKACRHVLGLAVLALLCAAPIRAQLILLQDGETLPTFEVATIKPAPYSHGMTIRSMPDGYQMQNVELSLMIQNAYGANSDAQLLGGSDALLHQHFDVQTKIDPSDAAQMKALSKEDRQRRMALMMQALLRERFHLKMHVETRELPIYALEVAKGGPKFQPTAPPAPEPATEPESGTQPPDQVTHRPSRPTSTIRISPTKAEMSVSGGTMKQLAMMLTVQGEAGNRVIFDMTGLTGKYDWHLEWTPEGMGMAQKGDDGSPPDSDAPGLFTALQEQLGLKLEPQKGPVQVVVIDHLEPPTPN